MSRPDFETWRDRTKDSVHRIGTEAGEVQSTLLMEAPRGVLVMPVPDLAKADLATAICEAAPTRVTIITEWTAWSQNPGEDREQRDIVLLGVAEQGGRSEYWFADIQSRDPWKLGGWTRFKLIAGDLPERLASGLAAAGRQN